MLVESEITTVKKIKKLMFRVFALIRGGGVRLRGDAGFALFLEQFFGNFFFNLRYCGFPRLCGLR